MPKPEEGGTADGQRRPGIGTPAAEREQVTRSTEFGAPEQEPADAGSVEDAYADYISRAPMTMDTPADHAEWHRIGDYPDDIPLPPAKNDAWLASQHVDPGAPKKEMFIKIAQFEDPKTGKPLYDSPVETLRRDLERLQGLGDKPSAEVLVARATLTDRDLGAWQAADDLKASTDSAQNSLRSAVAQLCSVYEAIVETLDQTVQAAKQADQATADGLRKRT
ncbi:hypothetical protein ABT294_02540 [Nonomuraea sp. NPDC000554]|uniref:hypothetical protein n=1 Tax=Nonomuraea sp. NPDC000554 TaxID=3154259 RepID=UPI003328F408